MRGLPQLWKEFATRRTDVEGQGTRPAALFLHFACCFQMYRGSGRHFLQVQPTHTTSKNSYDRAKHVPVIRNKLRDPGRLTTRKLTNSVACLADDPARRHRHCEHGDVTPEV